MSLNCMLPCIASLLMAPAFAQQPQGDAPHLDKPAVQQSPLAQLKDGRQAGNNNQILSTGIREIQPGFPPPLPSNHALIITVSEYQRSPLPGVLTDRKLGIELARRFGVPQENIVELSETQVTREGLRQAFATLNQSIMPGDKLYVYFSGHGARFFNKATNQCTESIVTQDMKLVTNVEFAAMIKPLAAKTDKTIVMLDSCHSGGVAQAAGTRSLPLDFRSKFSPEVSSPQCSVPVNLGSFATSRGADFHTTDHNLVILAAARNNEVAWDTSKGGAMTYAFEQCLAGGATDSDHSGSLSMQELADCVQARLDKTQEQAARQHATLAGNAGLVPAMTDAPPVPQPATPPAGATAPAPPAGPSSVSIVAALTDIYNQRDDRWTVDAKAGSPLLKIGTNMTLKVASDHEGYVYVFYRGTSADSFYLLFPNQLDADNHIAANQQLALPRNNWNVTALGPAGTDHFMVMITETPRDFSALALPAAYVSQAGPFEKIAPNPQAVASVGQAATLSSALARPECKSAQNRDLGVAKRCSNVFGASLLSVEETD
ncbi:MAG TPA: caspase family protein [Steroidobacteraceae bacterium]